MSDHLKTSLISDSDAKWIGSRDSLNKPNQWLCFRKTFHFTGKRGPTPVKIAADSKYWLWMNGNLVIREGQLKRGPAPDATYYDTVDIGPYLRAGENSIAVLLWYFGKHGFSHSDSGRPGLYVSCAGSRLSLNTNGSWKAVTHPSFANTNRPRANFRLPESNISFDARLEPSGWQNSDFDDSGWPQAEEHGNEGAAPWGKLIARSIPRWKESGLTEYVNSKALPLRSAHTYIRATLPHNAQVNPYLKINAPAGLKIDIRTDRYRAPYPIRATYITREGEQEFEVPTWMNGHEVHYKIPKSVNILALKYRETGYDTDFTGNFECNDPEINLLFKKARRTLYVNMRDHFMDCPDRERAPWFGDIINETGAAFQVFDTRSHELAKKCFLELFAWQEQDGRLCSPVPAGNWKKELPIQMLNAVGTFGLWNYFLYTGDAETLRTIFPGAKKYVDLWRTDTTGLAEKRQGDWYWGDWGLNVDMPALSDVWYALALIGLQRAASSIGNETDAQDFEYRLRHHKGAFLKNYWNGRDFRSKHHIGTCDIRVQALAVLAGLTPTDAYPYVRAIIVSRLDYSFSSPYYEKYIVEALFVMGYHFDALERMRSRHRGMLHNRYSTLPEHFLGFIGTNNHGWSSAPLTLLAQYVAGITPESPGFTKFRISTKPGNLNHISAVIPTVKGDIIFEFTRDIKTSHRTIKVEAPSDMEAVFDISPEDRGKTTFCLNQEAIK